MAEEYINQNGALAAFVRLVEGNLDPQYDLDEDATQKVQGALELYREVWGCGPEDHANALLEDEEEEGFIYLESCGGCCSEEEELPDSEGADE